MPIKYLCVDDEAPGVVEPLLERLRTEELSIVHVAPEEFGKQVRSVGASQCDGLIIDLRLDDRPGQQGHRVAYQATSLAQELRTRMTEKVLDTLPLVLWSVTNKFARAFTPDDTGKDLFDYVFDKHDVNKKVDEIRRSLISLVRGYAKIRDCLLKSDRFSYYRMLGLTERSAAFLDPRVGDRFLIRTHFPAHEYARFILNELLRTPGPLIDETVLAARLGVDIQESVDWPKLKRVLGSITYKGAFADGWPRWWAVLLEGWWSRVTKRSQPLRGLSAEERVAVLKSKAGLKRLRPLRSPIKGHSERFWTVCAALGTPLDPADGVMADGGDLRPWQEPRYLSLKSLRERRAKQKGLTVHPLDRERARVLLAQTSHA